MGRGLRKGERGKKERGREEGNACPFSFQFQEKKRLQGGRRQCDMDGEVSARDWARQDELGGRNKGERDGGSAVWQRSRPRGVD